jgi:flagellar basal body-associated protein FliL
MSRPTISQAGSSHIVALVGVLVIAVVAFAGYRVLHSSTPVDTASSKTSTAETAQVPSAIKSKSDVTEASKALDSTQIDDSVNPNSLNDDLNALQ